MPKPLTVKVTINGGPVNVWHKMGLKCNPFPAVPRYEYARLNQAMQQLDGDPIPDEVSLRRIVADAAPEFIAACVANFKPGQRTSFTITIANP